jgi:hypothetical protein
MSEDGEIMSSFLPLKTAEGLYLLYEESVPEDPLS